ncbi:MAG: hypothetical protein AAF682_24430 [Planctomycetota bacterium]
MSRKNLIAAVLALTSSVALIWPGPDAPEPRPSMPADFELPIVGPPLAVETVTVAEGELTLAHFEEGVVTVLAATSGELHLEASRFGQGLPLRTTLDARGRRLTVTYGDIVETRALEPGFDPTEEAFALAQMRSLLLAERTSAAAAAGGPCAPVCVSLCNTCLSFCGDFGICICIQNPQTCTTVFSFCDCGIG